ncbi:MAG: hypothetical protein NVS1B4_24760 [Gemmatimonadaceae bacterium]
MTTPRPPAFALTKWYLDGLTPDGRAAIAYHASLAWRSARVCWQAISVFEPGRSPRGRTSLAGSYPPDSKQGSVVWCSPHLECTFRAEPTVPADTSHGVIQRTLEDAAHSAGRLTLHGWRMQLLLPDGDKSNRLCRHTVVMSSRRRP